VKVPTPRGVGGPRWRFGGLAHRPAKSILARAIVIVSIAGAVIAVALASGAFRGAGDPRDPTATLKVNSPGVTLPDAGASAPMAASVPVRLEIPSIGVDSGLSKLGLLPDGTVEVPATGFPAGWYTGAPTPGELGPAIIVGHVDWKGPAVFFDLHLVAIGAEVDVTRTDGSVAVFRVTDVGTYLTDAFPTVLVYGEIPFAGLRLITCGGAFDDAAGLYDFNIVVFAELVRSSVPPKS